MNNIQQLRKERGWTQERLANEISVSRSTIAMWESGSSEPNNDFVVRLAKIFNTTTDHILGEYSPSEEILNAKRVFSEWMKSSEITFQELEEKTGTNIQTIKYWAENSGTYFNDKLSLIANAMGCSLDFLVGKTDIKEKPGTEVTPPELNEDLKNITEILKSLPPEKVKEIENYALFVLKQHNQ